MSFAIRRMVTLLVMVLTVAVISTCQPGQRDRIDPVTGYAYPTLEPEVWEGIE